MTTSTLEDRLRTEMNDALRAGEKVRLGALRMLASAIRYRQDELGRELTDDEIREVAGKEVKKRTESIEAFASAGRDELVAKEEAEREVVAAYAPEQLSEDAVDALIDRAIEQTGATSMKEMGTVMGAVMAEARGQVDGGLVQAKVKERLES